MGLQKITRLRRIGWCLGLTEEKTKELSYVLYETVTVTSKRYHKTPISSIGMPEYGYYRYTCHHISFDGESVSLELDDRSLFNSFEVGDQVRLGYKKEYTIIYDYIPPDFDKKQFIKKTLTKYRFVNAQKVG